MVMILPGRIRGVQRRETGAFSQNFLPRETGEVVAIFPDSD